MGAADRSRHRKTSPRLEGLELPLATLAGVMWREPVDPKLKAGGCGRCEWRRECKASVARGDFAFCEGPLERELVG